MNTTITIIVVAVIALAILYWKINNSSNSIKRMMSNLHEVLLSHFDKGIKGLKEKIPACENLGLLMPLLEIDEDKVAEKLAEAAENNDVETLRVFCDEFCVVKDIDMIVNPENNDTLAIIAAREWSEKFLLELKERGADFAIENDNQESANDFVCARVFEATENNNIDELMRLREINLLDDINSQRQEDKKTIGHIAVEKGHKGLFGWFIEEGGKTDILDSNQRTVDKIFEDDPEASMLVIKQRVEKKRAKEQEAN